PPRRPRAGRRSLVEPQVPHRLAVAADQAQRLDPDLDVALHEARADLRVGGLGLHALGDHRLVADQQQRAGRDAVGEAGREHRGGLHVDGHAAHRAQALLEGGVVLPDPAVGGVDGAGPVVQAGVADRGRDRALQGERGQRRHLRRQVVVAGALAADGGDRQDQVAQLVLALQPAALAQEQHRLGRDGREQVHERGRVRAAHAEVDHGDAIGGGARHRAVRAHDLGAGQAREMAQVAAEVGEQDVLAEAVERHAGVARQPVLDDLVLVLHRFLRVALAILARTGAIRPIAARPPARLRLPEDHGEPTMALKTHAALAAALALALAGCATTGASTGQARGADAGEAYPSTYRPIASAPVLVAGATVLDGTGRRLEGADVLMRDGVIVAVGQGLDVPADAVRVDGRGKWVTPGIIDIHSHLGVYPSPGTSSHSDGNEMTSPVTAAVWAEHSVWPQDPGFHAALAGGVTSLQILPGSANLVGGRGVTLKNVPATTYQGMKVPGAPHGLKLACGENPKRVYGQKGGPATRMGNVAGYRAAFIEAADYRDKRARGEGNGRRDLKLETLAGALDGDIRVHIHCYRADEMATMLDLADEFGF